MIPLLLVLLLILVLFGTGFAVQALWYVAIAVLVLWVLGFFMRSGRARWYRW
ncbi:hydrophobic protein [Streptomyces sp. NPDC003943]